MYGRGYPNTARTTERPQHNQPAKPQHHILRQNSKWSRLQYYPACTAATVRGNLYDESWKDFPPLFPQLSASLCLSAPCLTILYVFFNELLCSSIHYNFIPLFLLSSLPSVPSSVLSSAMSLLIYSLVLSLFNVNNSVLFRREPWL